MTKPPVKMKRAGNQNEQWIAEEIIGLIFYQHGQRSPIRQLTIGIGGGDKQEKIQVGAVPKGCLRSTGMFSFLADDILPGSLGCW